MKLLSRLGTALVLVLLTAAGVMSWRALDQSIEVVRVTGALTPAERERAAELVSAHLPAGVLSLSVGALRATLEQEDWIDEVGVWRQWPDGVRIDLVPTQAVARWGHSALLSSRGELVRPVSSVDTDELPYLQGPEGEEVRVMALFQRLSARLRPYGLTVARLEMHGDRTLQAELGGGAVLIARESDLGGQLRRLEALLQSPLRSRFDEVARLDTRYDNGVAVAWHAGEDGRPQHLAKGF